jgi:hypothetical protein
VDGMACLTFDRGGVSQVRVNRIRVHVASYLLLVPGSWVDVIVNDRGFNPTGKRQHYLLTFKKDVSGSAELG